MKSRYLIEERLRNTTDPKEIEMLMWVLESPECPICASSDPRGYEVKIHRGENTPAFLEAKMGWNTGTVLEHMEHHVSYDPVEADYMEKMRSDSINTLNATEDIAQRVLTWIEEMEHRKEMEGEITDEWISSISKLVSQAQGMLKLGAQLKKEIGVDSQLLLADRKVDAVMGILVDVLSHEPTYLDQIQMRLQVLNAPSNTIIDDADFEVVD